MKNVLANFKIDGEFVSCVPYGEGHINDTYLVTFKNDPIGLYILQRINHNIFKDVKGLMNNISLVTNYLKEKEHDVDGRKVLTIVKTKDDKDYYYDEANDKYYRVYIFVKDSLTLQKASTKELFEESAIAFGRFVNLLADFDTTPLIEVIKDFHNSEERFNHFVKTLKEDKLDRAKYCQEEIKFILDRKDDCSKIVNLLKENKLPTKVTHNDTKLNNVLLDINTLKALCVIDLDTVMPGSSLYDFGDSIRFGCNNASEDEKDLSKVTFNIDYFYAFTKGYLSQVKDSLNQYELDNLVFGAKLMTLECGIRFLDDYLDGDHYFKIHRDGHNLDRCKTQLKLVLEIEKHFDELNDIVKSIMKTYS